jgi:pyridoxamine 5'-phosphate oxidase
MSVNGRHQRRRRCSPAHSIYKDMPIRMPEHWGGYLATQQTVEFWQGRKSRLHDRLPDARTDHGWELGRLAS